MLSSENIFFVKFRGYTIYFILHALTLITAFTWHQLLQEYLETLKSTSSTIRFTLIYALFITIFSVLLHLILGKYAKEPDN